MTDPPKDLFGEPTLQPAGVGDRKRNDKARGFAAPPGTGPAGETCRTCRHSWANDQATKRYWKCALVKPTRGPGSDIRIRAAACRRWEAKS